MSARSWSEINNKDSAINGTGAVRPSSEFMLEANFILISWSGERAFSLTPCFSAVRPMLHAS
jgi:hypothetical protein